MYNRIVAQSDSVCCSIASAESGPRFLHKGSAPTNSVERLSEKMNLERRNLQRESPEKLSYIQFEPDGGGIVVNASEQGLAFHAANAVRQPGPIRLCISPNPTQRLELAAEIVWMDDAKKFGGLRFTEVTAHERNEIRQWLAETAKSMIPGTNLEVPTFPSKEEPEPCPVVRKRTAGPPRIISSPEDARHPLAEQATSSRPRSYNIPSTSHMSEPFSQRNHTSSLIPLARGLALGILFFALVSAAFLFLGNVRQEVGSSLIRFGEKLKRDADTPTETSSSPPVRISKPDSGNPPVASDPTRESPSTETPDESRPASSVPSTTGTGNSAGTRQAGFPVSRLHFADTHSRSDRSAFAQQLWSAVEAGDSSAEAALAQLYLTGDGVPRSCEQARVLLHAASKKGNIEAGQQLRKLNNKACR